MLKKTAIAMMSGLATWFVVSCNSSSSDVIELPSSALITSFNLQADDSVLVNLDSIFFSIDLATGNIFNADSLPYGTKTDALVPSIVVNSASKIEILEPRPGRTDSIHDYINHTTDSINFSNGPVGIRVTSIDGLTVYNYKVSVNVHQQEADSLMWTNKVISGVPSRWQFINDQRTVAQGLKTYSLTRSQTEYCITKVMDYNGSGYANATSVTPQFTFTPNLRSFSASDNRLYILDTDGNLYYSDTEGDKWSPAGVKWNYIYGSYGDKLFGAKKDGDKWLRVTFPDLTVEEIPADFPISGTSVPVSYSWQMSDSKQILITGGRLANGSLSASTWGYDGSSWMRLSQTKLPHGFENMSVFPYYVAKADSTTWRINKNSALFAMYGNNAEGKLNDTLYVSNDFGMTWKKAPILLQPGAFPARTDAQAYVIPVTLTANSRATKPITEWECPYIFMFGGYNADGILYNTVLRGAINSLQNKPLQKPAKR